MAKLELVKKCFNCGAILQTEDRNAPGYIAKRLLEENSHFLFCDKCYEEDKYNLLPPTLTLPKDFKILLKDAKATESLIVYFIDLFSFEVSFIPELNNLLTNQKVLIVGTRRDLLPNTIKDDDLKEYVKHRLRVEKINPLDVVFSSGNQKSLKLVAERIKELREKHDIYLIGSKFAGKTLSLDAYLKTFSNNTKRNIKRCFYPHTNIKVMQIPLDKSSTAYDTEGLDISNSFFANVEPAILKEIKPTCTLTNRRLKVGKNESIFVGGLIRLDVINCKSPFYISHYFSNNVHIKKIISKQLDSIFESNLKKKNIKPVSAKFTSLKNFNIFQISIEESGERDLGIEGLGWFSFTGNKQIFLMYVPKGIAVYSSRAKIPFQNK